MAIYELTQQQTKQVRYVKAESETKAVDYIIALYKARPQSAFRYWADADQIEVRTLSPEEVSTIDPSHIEFA